MCTIARFIFITFSFAKLVQIVSNLLKFVDTNCIKIIMSIFSDNIRALRIKHKSSQEDIAENLLISRTRYAKYEEGRSEPPFDILKKIAQYYQLSIDILLSVDVRKIEVEKLLQLENNRLILPIQVDKSGENIIEVVTQKAKAGYLSGYADPEYIEQLQQISLPFLGLGKYRGFPVEGDSMPPHQDGDIIVGRYVEQLGEVLSGKTYIVITRNEGVVYKRLNKQTNNKLKVSSDNFFYPPYEIKASQVLEIWEYQCSISRSDVQTEAIENTTIKNMFYELKNEITDLKNKLVE